MTTSNGINLNLYDLPQPALERALAPIVSPPFRIKQIEESLREMGRPAT